MLNTWTILMVCCRLVLYVSTQWMKTMWKVVNNFIYYNYSGWANDGRIGGQRNEYKVENNGQFLLHLENLL